MSLGWMNLQDYLGANAGNVDDQATKLDAATYQQAPQANGTQPTSMGYGEYLARKRSAATEEGAAALMGGNAADVMLARRGKSSMQTPQTFDPRAKATQDAANRKQEADYWAQQKTRNSGLAEQGAADRRRQDDAFGTAREAVDSRKRKPTYAAYSDAAQKSRDAARGKEVRTISDEEWNTWTR